VSADSSALPQHARPTLHFIDGTTQRDETPGEYVRQEIAKSIVREYGYAKRDIAVEHTLRLGSRKPRADIVIFFPAATHSQDQAFIIIECKAKTVKPSDRKEGVGQLQSYSHCCILNP
jgi:type I restriction enzyme M protein